MINLFDWLRPERWRKRARMEEDRQMAVLSRISENDPSMRALMELLCEQFEAEMQSLLRGDLPPVLAEYQRGRASAVYALIDRIESERARAKDEAKARMEAERKRSETAN